MKVRYERVVDCPAELAFAYYADRDKDREWWLSTIETEVTSEVVGGVGETSHQRHRFPGIPLEFEQDIEIVEWEAPHRWREVCRNGFTHYDCWYVVEPVDARRTRMILDAEVRFHGLARLLAPIARRSLERIAQRSFDTLKRNLDALGAAPTPSAEAAVGA